MTKMRCNFWPGCACRLSRDRRTWTLAKIIGKRGMVQLMRWDDEREAFDVKVVLVKRLRPAVHVDILTAHDGEVFC